MPHPATTGSRDLIIGLAAQSGLPAAYPFQCFAKAGGLMSYGVDQVEMFRLAASYVDRILRGAEPGELPVQATNKLELVVNLKAAKALGLTIPQSILVQADEVIE